MVFGGAVVGCSGRAGVKAAGFAGVRAIIDLNFEGWLVLPEKGEKRCGESAAGLRAMQDINTAIFYVQDALGIATNTCLIFARRRTLKSSSVIFQFVFQGSHSDKIHRPGAGEA